MAEHEDSLMEKVVGDIHDHDGSDDGNKSLKSKFAGKKPVHKLFGGGKYADVILWRDKKTSAIVLGSATAMWIVFELLEYSLITLVCHSLIVSLGMLFLWSNASTFINKSPPKIPDVVLPEKCLLEVASALRVELNKALDIAREVASGRDLKTFLCVVAGLWVLSIVGNWFNFLTLFYIVFVLLHTMPYFYEQHEERVDLMADKAMIEMKKQYVVLDEKVLRKIPVQQFLGQLKDKKKE